MVLLEEFQALIQQAGGRLVGEGYYGVWEGYPFTAYVEKLRQPGVVSFNFRLAGPVQKWLLQELRNALPRGCKLMVRPRFHYQLLCKGQALRSCGEKLGEILYAFTRDLRRAGMLPPDRCPLCRQGGCDAYVDMDGYVEAHWDCVEAMTKSYQRQAERAAKSGHYVSGVLGALLGGLLVSLLILVAYYLDWEVWFGYLFLPLGTYYGYKLCQGRMGRGALVCSCAAAVLYLLLIEQAFFYIFVHLRYDIWPSVLDTFVLYWRMMTVGEVFSDMWMPALMLLVGLVLNWRRIRQTPQTDDRTVRRIRSTLMEMQEEG